MYEVESVWYCKKCLAQFKRKFNCKRHLLLTHGSELSEAARNINDRPRSRFRPRPVPDVDDDMDNGADFLMPDAIEEENQFCSVSSSSSPNFDQALHVEETSPLASSKQQCMSIPTRPMLYHCPSASASGMTEPEGKIESDWSMNSILRDLANLEIEVQKDAENSWLKQLEQTVECRASVRSEKSTLLVNANNDIEMMPDDEYAFPSSGLDSDSSGDDSETDDESFNEDDFALYNYSAISGNSSAKNSRRIISHKEHMLSVLAYSLRHHVSQEQVNDLLQLIELHLPENNHVEKNLDNIKNACCGELKFGIHDYCSNCFAPFPEHDLTHFRCSTIGCSG